MKLDNGIFVFDRFLRDPEAHRIVVLEGDFRTYDFGHTVFHGINNLGKSSSVPEIIERFLGLQPTLSFARRSPLGQVEPHFIHTDVDMGDWSALLYLSPDPDPADGTDFWTHNATGETMNLTPHLRSEEGNTTEGWTKRWHVQAKFNRLLMFESNLYHSRAIHENYGAGDDARLVQVTFGKGNLSEAIAKKEAA